MNDRLRELELVYETAPVGLCVLDRELRFVRINRRFAALNGASIEAHLGRTIREMLPAVADAVQPALERVLATGEAVVDFELSGETAAHPGVARTWSESWYPLRDADGAVIGINVVAQDITERKHAEQSRREADGRKASFLAVLGHELRNPLATVASGTRILARGETSDGRIRVLQMMERQLKQMTRLVDDLLDVGRIESGKLALRHEPVELASIVANAVEASAALIASFAHRLDVELPDGPVVLRADPARIAQVIVNLLNNAARFTPRGGHIVLAARADGPEAVICVRDTGIGFDAAERAALFDLFAQGVGADGASGAGLGIGLALVRSLVEQHGGSVDAESDGQGAGSTFTVRLPLAGRSPAMSAARVAAG